MPVDHAFGFGRVRFVVVNATETSRVHADVVGPGDVRAPEIAYVDGLGRPNAQLGQCLGEDLVPGLRDADLVREAEDLEVLEDPVLFEELAYDATRRRSRCHR